MIIVIVNELVCLIFLDAIQSLFMYSNVMTLLDKQKVKKSYLADYLNQKGVRMTTPATKRTLQNDILEYWRRGRVVAVDDNDTIRVQAVSYLLRTTENRAGSNQF